MLPAIKDFYLCDIANSFCKLQAHLFNCGRPGLAETLGKRLKAARRGVFVGREREQKRFQELLTGNESPGVLWLHGPGGVGKSSLVRELASLARELKVPVFNLDARDLEATPAAFSKAVAAAMNLPVSADATSESVLETIQQYVSAKTSRLVLFLDTFEFFAPLESWFRDEFLPSLPDNLFLVFAGRRAPDAAWRADAGWRDLVHVQALRNLQMATAGDYLMRRGVPTAQHGSVLQFTHGHPLALSLIADVFEQRQANGEDSIVLQFTPEDTPDVVRTLLGQLVEGETSPEHRAALEACALVRLTTEDLLAALLDKEDANQAFNWLRGLSFIESGRQGLFPHDMAREVLLADLRWRNPGQHRLLHERARTFYSARLKQGGPDEQQQVLMDYVFLHRHNPMVRPFLDWRENSALTTGTPRPHEIEELIAIVKKHEGKEAAQLARHWFGAQPQNLTVLRDSQGAIAGLMMMVSLAQAGLNGVKHDPATKAAWDYLQSHAPLRPGEEATMVRFWMAREGYQNTSPVQSLIFVNIVRHYLTTHHLAFSFFTCATPDFWTPLFTYASSQRLPEADFKIGKQTYGVFGHDWRALPPMEWLDLLGEREVNAAPHHNTSPETPLVVLTHEDFYNAVHAALRDWQRPDQLAANVLLRTRLVTNRAGREATDENRVAALQSLIKEACESLRGARREGKFYRALYYGYLKPAATQERAAEAMDVPFSTYRRHLKSGVRTVADLLWKREIGG